MKTRAILTAVALFAASAAPAFASCDVLKADEDKQARCAQKCDDAYISGKMHYGADIAKVTEEKKACDAACGCSANTK
jgi:hypothetical protein